MKKELKQIYPEFTFSLVDIIASIDPSETNKYLPFLMKTFKTKMENCDKEIIKEVTAKSNAINNGKPTEEKWYMSYFKNCLEGEPFFNRNDLETIRTFDELLKNNRIENNDIHSYTSWKDFATAIEKSILKYEKKDLGKQVDVILDDENYLIIRPLTHEASIKYGYNTRWCTSGRNSRSTFDDYAGKGILIYFVNKTNYNKLALFSRVEKDYERGGKLLKELQFYNAEDARIDSTETTFDSELLKTIVLKIKNNPKTNYELAVERMLVPKEDDCIQKTCSDMAGMEQPLTEEFSVNPEPLNQILNKEEEVKIENKKINNFFTNIKNLFKKRRTTIIIHCNAEQAMHWNDQIKKASGLLKGINFVLLPNSYNLEGENINHRIQSIVNGTAV